MLIDYIGLSDYNINATTKTQNILLYCFTIEKIFC